MIVPIKKISPDARLPRFGSDLAAGADLFACIPGAGQVTVAPGETVMCPTGIAVAIPEGYAGFIFARSGLSVRQGLAPANKVGVIDADYRGEIMVALHNHSDGPRVVSDGDRIAQMIILETPRFSFAETDDLPDTLRGAGGFGSTGK